MTDELKLSWDKKVSMREIAQFYEDRIRELDAKEYTLQEKVLCCERRLRSMEPSLRILESEQSFRKSLQLFRDRQEQIEASQRRIAEDTSRLLNELVRATEFLANYEDSKRALLEQKAEFIRYIRETAVDIQRHGLSAMKDMNQQLIDEMKKRGNSSTLRVRADVDELADLILTILVRHDPELLETTKRYFHELHGNEDVVLDIWKEEYVQTNLSGREFRDAFIGTVKAWIADWEGAIEDTERLGAGPVRPGKERGAE